MDEIYLTGYSEPYQKLLIRYWNEYSNSYDVSKESFIYYLTTKILSSDSKRTLASGLGNYLLHLGILTQNDYKEIVQLFPNAHPPLPVISNDIFERILKLARVMNPSELTRERNTALLLLMSESKYKLSALLDLDSNDVQVCDCLKLLDEKYDLNYNKGGFKLGNSIEAYLHLRKETFPFFVNRNRERLLCRYIERLLYEVGKELNLRITPHSLYGLSVRNSIKNIGLLKTQQRFGHSNISNTLNYMEVL